MMKKAYGLLSALCDHIFCLFMDKFRNCLLIIYTKFVQFQPLRYAVIQQEKHLKRKGHAGYRQKIFPRKSRRPIKKRFFIAGPVHIRLANNGILQYNKGISAVLKPLEKYAEHSKP